MKTLIPTLLFTFLVIVTCAQAPEAISYQVVARDISGNLLTNQTVSFRLSIFQGIPGPLVYSESHATITNNYGIAILQIGDGTVISGVFSNINWELGTYFLQTELDPAGGASYQNMGTTQLLSVPYALYAKTSGSSPGSLPSGTSGQTLRHDGNTWIANSNLVNDGTNIGIGLTAPECRLHVTLTSDENKKGLFSFVNQTSSSVNYYNYGMMGGASGNTNKGYAVGVTGWANASSSYYGQGIFGLLTNTDSPSLSDFAFQRDAAVMGNGGTDLGSGGYFTTNANGHFGVGAQNLNTTGLGILAGGNGTGLTYPTAGAGGSFCGSPFGSTSFASSSSGTGVLGRGNNIGNLYTATSGSGGAFSGSKYGVYGYANNTTGERAGGIFQVNPTASYYANVCYISSGGTNYKINGTGSVSTIVQTKTGERVNMFCAESPEILLTDYGTGKLINGSCHIDLDPTFTNNIVVDETHPIKVFIQLYGDCKGVFVSNQNTDGFNVIELQGGTSNVSFCWSVVANRCDERDQDGNILSKNQDVRFPAAPEPPEVKEVEVSEYPQ